MPEKTDQNSTKTASPWQPQASQLNDIWGSASNLYNTASGNLYSGQQVAQFTPEQLATARSMLGYSSGSNIPGTTQYLSNNLGTAGIGGVTGSLSGLNSFNPSNPTGQNIEDASAYANSQYLSGAANAATADARRTLINETLPGIAQRAALQGNTNSSATGNTEQRAIDELARNEQNVSATLRGNAYQSGINTAEGAREANMTSRLGALTGGGSLGLGAASAGIGGLSSSINQQGSLFDIANAGGGALRDANQAGIDNARAMSEYGPQYLMSLLGSRYGMGLGGQYGGTTTETGETKKYASPYTVAGAALGAAGAGLYGGPNSTFSAIKGMLPSTTPSFFGSSFNGSFT